MNNRVNLEQFTPRTRRAFAVGIVLALGVLAATIFSGLLYVRGLVREQILQRDAEALHATTLMEQLDDADPAGIELRTDEQIGFDAAIRASRLKGVLGIRFYDTNGDFSDAIPSTILPLPLGEKTLKRVRTLKPASWFTPAMPMSSVFIYLPQFAEGRIAHVPMVQVTVPLHRRNTQTFAGAAQFIIEGGSIAAEYERLDRRLVQIAAGTFVIAGLLLIAMLWPVFRRMEKLTRDLSLRSMRLQRANEELALAARASALGAVSAHLMHGLKNPLASLSQFVSSRGSGDAGEDAGDWGDALAASRRMQALVEHTMEVLGDARGGPVYELSVDEMMADVWKRVDGAADRKGITLSMEAEGNCMLSSRTANLASLVLVNLTENAIEATPSGGRVSLRVARESGQLCYRVSDEGSGFPEHLQHQLFIPCKSTREGGSGIGLAISKQIADHLEARLELEECSPEGCVFLLQLPASACQEPTGPSGR